MKINTTTRLTTLAVLACLVQACSHYAAPEGPPNANANEEVVVEDDGYVAVVPGQGSANSGGAVDEEVVTIGSRVEKRGAGFKTDSRSLPRARRRPPQPTPSPAAIAPPVEQETSTGPWQVSASADDEIWYIARAESASSAARDDAPGSGALIATNIQGTADSRRPFPLEHTSARAAITGYISAVDVTQRFANPFDVKIEAAYVFPLPEDAAITDFVMRIGERQIRGVLRERREAERLYAQAKAQGHRASLLSQRRPNVFEQRVGNIEPGEAIDIDIRYFHTLTYSDGWYRFVFPTTVGPRFNPPGTPDPLVAVGADAPPSASGKEVRYLRPGQRSGHDLDLRVDIDAGLTVEEIHSNTHPVNVDYGDDLSTAQVRLATVDTLVNRDFVLRYRLAGDAVGATLFTDRAPGEEEEGGYFTLMLTPPAVTERLERAPMEMVFVLDCSGSMKGWALDRAKQAVDRALDLLRPTDTFQIIQFSNNSSTLGGKPLRVTPQNLQRARAYLARLNGAGGTQMIEGIKAALDFPHDRRRLRVVTFLTDGYIGNEQEILTAVHERLGDARIFSVGIGASPNRYLMERMAAAGRGAAAFIGLNDESLPVMDLYMERISHPALMNVRVDWGDMDVSEVYPSTIPDLFVGRPVVLTGRYRGSVSPIRIHGDIAGEQGAVRIDASPAARYHEAVARVWARRRIADLKDRQASTPGERESLAAQIRTTALVHGLVSGHTSFVAVDGAQRTAGSYGVTVQQPVAVPAGVAYETTVVEDAVRALSSP